MTGHYPKALLMVIGALLIAVSFRVFLFPPRSSLHSIAVLPVENLSLNPGRSDHLSAGFEALISARLKALPGLQVIEIAGGGPDVHLNTEALVSGTFLLEAERVECSVILLDRSTGETMWEKTVHGQREGLLELQSSLLVDVAEYVRGSLNDDERKRLVKPPASSFEAYEAFRRGELAIYSTGREAKAEALEYFQKALSLDPSMADAYVGVGAIYNQYHYSGWGQENLTHSEAELHFKAALDLEPTHQRARAGLIRVRWAQGQSEEILKLVREASQHGRADLDEFVTRAQGFIFAGLAERAKPLLEEALRVNPDLWEAHFFLHLALMHTGSFESVLESGEFIFDAYGDQGMPQMGMGLAYWYLDDREQAYRQYEKSIELYGDAVPGFVLYELGRLHDEGGDRERAREAWTRGKETLSARLEAHPHQPMERAVLCAILGGLGERERLEREVALLKSEILDNGFNLTYAAIGLLGLGEHRQALDLLDQGFEGGYNLGALDTTRPMMANVPATWLIHLDEFETLRRLEGFAGLNARAIERENRLRAFY